MIIVRVPFRLPLGGGGSDLPAYYKKYEGSLITSTINKYMYVSINEPIASDKIKLYYKYTEIRDVKDIDKIEHNIIRECLLLHNIQKPIEIGSMADIEAQTGMGSSSVFTVGLLAGLNILKRKFLSQHEIAEEACYVEIDLVGKPIGKQDQYAAAYGGINKLFIDKRGNVTVSPIHLSQDTIFELENRLLMFYTGISRDANEVLADQGKKIEDKSSIDYMHTIKQIGIEIEHTLMKGNVTEFGRLLNHHWTIKKEVSTKMTNSKINDLYTLAQSSGAIGGKIMGAGGGGFFLLCAKEGQRQKLKTTMEKSGLKYMDFRFEFEGVKIITNL
jgi:D-glycero-alpha-D-manno-heptose-7-phosphate kinase